MQPDAAACAVQGGYQQCSMDAGRAQVLDRHQQWRVHSVAWQHLPLRDAAAGQLPAPAPPSPPPPLLQRQHVCTQQCDACQSMLCICLCCLLCTHASENSRCHILCPSVAMVSGSRHLQQHLPAAHLQLTAMQQLVSITLGCATDCLLKIDS